MENIAKPPSIRERVKKYLGAKLDRLRKRLEPLSPYLKPVGWILGVVLTIVEMIVWSGYKSEDKK